MEFDSKDAALAYRRLMEAEGWESVIERKGWGKWLVKLSNSPKLIGGNPAVSGKQYRLAQAVLGGANVEGMPRSVAREIVNRTPKELRSEYARGGNPFPKGYEHILEAQHTNEERIRHYKGKLKIVDHDGQKFVLTGVNDTGVLYWSKPGQKKQFVVYGYRVSDIPELVSEQQQRKSNPEDSAAAMYESFHGTPSSQVVEIEEQEHYHENLAELGVCCGVVVETVMGNVVAVGLSGYEWKGKGKDAGFVYTGEERREENPLRLGAVGGRLPVYIVKNWQVEHMRGIFASHGIVKLANARKLAGKSGAQFVMQVTDSEGRHVAYAVPHASVTRVDLETKIREAEVSRRTESNPLKSPWTVSRAAREAYAAGYAGKHQFTDWVKLKRLDDRSSGFLSLIKQDYLRGLEDEHHDAQGKRATGRTRGVGSHEGYEIVRTEGGEYVAPKWDADSKFESLHLVKAAIDAHPNPKRGPVGSILHDSRSALFGAAGAVDREIGKAIGNPPQDVHREVVAAARDLARKGLHGEPGDKLPNLMSGDAVRWINDNLAAFRHIVSTERIIHSKRKGNPHDDVEPETTLLCSNEDGTQLFLIGGDQCLDLEGLGIIGDMATKEEIVIGCVQQCWYSSQKSFDKFQQIDYFHNFSEDSKNPLPELVYNRVNEQLSLVGGSYHINQPLMGVSPGIED